MSPLSQKNRARKSYPPIQPGDVFGRLTALDGGTLIQGPRQKHNMVRVRCECGAEKLVRAASLNTGTTSSCGCGIAIRAAETVRQRSITHGMSKTPVYGVYRTMISRCENPSVERYPLYGGRGIKVCERWRGENGFDNFMEDMGPRPDGYSIERVNSNGNYEPENCRWASSKEQANNTARNRVIEWQGRSMTQAQWEEETGIPRVTIAFRLKSGWPVDKALTTPVRRKS